MKEGLSHISNGKVLFLEGKTGVAQDLITVNSRDVAIHILTLIMLPPSGSLRYPSVLTINSSVLATR